MKKNNGKMTYKRFVAKKANLGRKKHLFSAALVALFAGIGGLFAQGKVANADTTSKAAKNTTTRIANPKRKVTVKSGDTLWKIAQAYGVSVSSIKQANGISNPNVIQVGTSIIIPSGSSAPQSVTKQANQVTTKAATTTGSYTANTTNKANNTSSQSQSTTTATSGNSAKAWIAARESSNSYTASNGRYYGKYQLDSSYLNGDYSAANQEKVADSYVASRYGSWEAAKAFWQAHGWY